MFAIVELLVVGKELSGGSCGRGDSSRRGRTEAAAAQTNELGVFVERLQEGCLMRLGWQR